VKLVSFCCEKEMMETNNKAAKKNFLSIMH